MSLKEKIRNHKSLLESFLSLSVLNALVVLIPIVAMPYVLRVVGPANYGLYGFIYILVQYVLVFNNYGFDFSVTKEVAQHRGDAAYLNRIYNAVLGCRLLLFVAASAFFFALSPLILPTSTHRLMFLGGLTLVLGNTFTAVWLFQGMEKMRYLTLVNVFGKGIFLLLVFLTVKRPEHYVFLPLLDGLGYMAGGSASLLIARKQFGMRLRMPSWADMKTQFSAGAAIFGSTLGMTLYRKSNIFILRFFVGDAALGLYTAAEKVVTGLQSVVSPVSQALFPYLGHDFAGKTNRENLLKLKKISLYMACILLVAMAAVFFCSDFLVQLLCGSEFAEASRLLRIMSPVLFFGGMNYILGIVGLVNLNQSGRFLRSVLIAGITSVIWVLCSAPFLGEAAGAWAMTLSETVLFCACLLGLYRLR
ncbi:MAG: oligosaccharide flippase family protein [Bacteroides sp.]|nr:oligosaccharide flippase family protein [Ruminococcus flavefaciens]MCM1554260.1 oligosaccharide flippase family protein [Bacteroides sp.]